MLAERVTTNPVRVDPLKLVTKIGTQEPPNKPMQRTGLRPAADRQSVSRTTPT